MIVPAKAVGRVTGPILDRYDDDMHSSSRWLGHGDLHMEIMSHYMRPRMWTMNGTYIALKKKSPWNSKTGASLEGFRVIKVGVIFWRQK